MLKQVIKHLGISLAKLQEQAITWNDAENRLIFLKNLPKAMKHLDALKECISDNMRKKLLLRIFHMI